MQAKKISVSLGSFFILCIYMIVFMIKKSLTHSVIHSWDILFLFALRHVTLFLLQN